MGLRGLRELHLEWTGRERRFMRILQVVPTLSVGGAQRVVTLLARYLHRAPHVVGVVSMYDSSGTWVEELRSAGVPLFFLGKRRGLDLRMVRRMATVFARFRPDVLHTHMYVLKYALPALIATRHCRVVHTLHNLAQHEVEGPSRILQFLAFRAGVAPVAIGDAVAESVRRVYRLPSHDIIPNGIPVEDYAPPAGAREEIRHALRIPADAPTFLAVGRLAPQKNCHALIAAFGSRRLTARQAHLLLAGDGVERGGLEEQARLLGVASRVHFLGVRTDVPRLLAASDAFVLASRFEGNPLAVMEAMAAGRPVLATAVGCVPELVTEGTGLLVPPDDVPALEAAMLEIAEDLPLAHARGRAAARVARDRFDASTMAAAYERLYVEMTGSA